MKNPIVLTAIIAALIFAGLGCKQLPANIGSVPAGSVRINNKSKHQIEIRDDDGKILATGKPSQVIVLRNTGGPDAKSFYVIATKTVKKGGTGMVENIGSLHISVLSSAPESERYFVFDDKSF